MSRAHDSPAADPGTEKARYRPGDIEPKWQRYWLEHKTFRAEIDRTKPK